MTDVKTIELAKQAGFEYNSLGMTYTSGSLSDSLERFAKLVAEHEREECAKLIEEMPCDCCWPEDSIPVAVDFADAIRARGEA
jgi:hypothetical protein